MAYYGIVVVITSIFQPVVAHGIELSQTDHTRVCLSGSDERRILSRTHLVHFRNLPRSPRSPMQRSVAENPRLDSSSSSSSLWRRSKSFSSAVSFGCGAEWVCLSGKRGVWSAFRVRCCCCSCSHKIHQNKGEFLFLFCSFFFLL